MATRKQLKKRLFGKTGSVISMLTLTASFFLVEIIVGYMTNSMALVADSFHMLSDVMSLIVGFVALRYSKRSERTDRNTFGWQRAEVLGALVNAVFLIALCFSILVESFKRLVEPESITRPILVLAVGAAGLFINLIGLALFHRHGHGHSHGGGGHGQSHAGHGQSHAGHGQSHAGHGHNHGGHGHSHGSDEDSHGSDENSHGKIDLVFTNPTDTKGKCQSNSSLNKSVDVLPGGDNGMFPFNLIVLGYCQNITMYKCLTIVKNMQSG